MNNSTRKPCPVCHRASLKEFKPFCSKRCADEDLGKWFAGGYAVPGERVGANDDEEEEEC